MGVASNSVIVQPLANPIAGLGEMLGNDFMRYAFLAGTSMAVLGGLVGYFVVLRRLAFGGEALSHVAFTAAVGSYIFGFDPLLGMFVVTGGVSAGMAAITGVARSYDVALGTVLAWVLGLGALFLTVYTSNPTSIGCVSSVGSCSNGQVALSTLFGSILGIEFQEAVIAAVVAGTGVLALVFIARPLLFASLDPVVARIRGVPVRLVGIVFLVLLAITVTEAVRVVGALLVLSLLVMPAATAQRWATRPVRGLLLSGALGVAFVWLGLVLGYYFPYPVSFFVTSIAFVTYVATLAIQYGLHRWTKLRELRVPQVEPARQIV